MHELETIIESFQKNEIDSGEMRNRLLEFMFTNKHRLGMTILDEDEFSDFLVFMTPKLERIIGKYTSEIGTFSTYFIGVLNISRQWWQKKHSEKLQKRRCCTFVSEEAYEEKSSFYTDNESARSIEINESTVSLEELEKKVQEKLTYKKMGRSSRNKELKISREEQSATMLLVLALKSCYFIDEPMMLKIAEITNRDPQWLSAVLSEARSTIEAKVRHIKKIEQARNASYFFRKQLLMHRQELQDLYSSMITKDEKLKIHTQRWEKCVKAIGKKNHRLSPSNVTVARILGLNARQVAYILKIAYNNIDTQRLKCYLDSHEDIFGNRKCE